MALFDHFKDEVALGLWVRVVEEPHNRVLKGVLADRLNELDSDRGTQRWTDFAHALRWCAKHGKHPRRTPASKYLVWHRQSHGQKVTAHTLPSLLLPGRGKYYRFTGLYTAMNALAESLRRVIAEVSV